MPEPKQKKGIIDNEISLTKSTLLAAASLLILISLFSERMGLVGGFLQRVLLSLFGFAAYLLPLLLLSTTLAAFLGRKLTMEKFSGFALLFITVLVGLQLSNPGSALVPNGCGGLVGQILTLGLVRLFGRIGSWILLGTLVIVALILTCEEFILTMSTSLKNRFTKKPSLQFPTATSLSNPESNPTVQPTSPVEIKKGNEPEVPVKTNDSSSYPEQQPELPKSEGPFSMPPFSILKNPVRLKNQRVKQNINENIKILEQTLANFSVQAKVTEVCYGPTITRYEIYPAPGVKVSRIVSLSNDIALSLAATGIRIEAPIPGKAAIGIEVPNKKTRPVFLREVIETSMFDQSKSPLTVALGKDISGAPVIADLTQMPHLLIAGATGSGKSVCINTIICSILFKSTPDQVKLLLIDPKMVELSNFNGIPHLLAPVVTDTKKTAGVLNWLVTEMENRYSLFATAGVRDIERYNKADSQTKLPFILVVIDELADLMMVAPAEVEGAICRLAQMARATGIHLIMATQRPSVDVITGLIKANIPSRLSFAVSSQTDSRTILDINGAEKLLGKGDMLFYPVGASKPRRIQGALVSDQEVRDLVLFWRDQGMPKFDQAILEAQPQSQSNSIDDLDELFYQALELVVDTGQASASYLQRRFRIGYTRAARIMDQLEAKGYISPPEGSKARDVLIDKKSYEHLLESGKL